MIKVISISAYYLLFISSSLQAGTQYPFPIDMDKLVNTPVSNLNQQEFPNGIQESHRIVIKDGHFYTQGVDINPETSRRIRFWGINLTPPMTFLDEVPREEFAIVCAADGVLESECEVEMLARRFDKMGINIVRLNALDSNKYKGDVDREYKSLLDLNQPFPTFDTDRLQKLDRLIAVFSRHGIYVSIPLRMGYEFSSIDCIDTGGTQSCVDPVSDMPDGNGSLDHFDNTMIELQKVYAKKIINHFKDMPSVAMYEINNESTLINYYKDTENEYLANFPEPHGSRFNEMWQEWLQTKYTTIDNLQIAWQAPPPVDKGIIVDDGSFDTLAIGDEWKVNNSAGCTENYQWGSVGIVENNGDKEVEMTLNKLPCKDYYFQLRQPNLGDGLSPVGLDAGIAYQISFVARTDSTIPHGLGVSIQYYDGAYKTLRNETKLLPANSIEVSPTYYFYSPVAIENAQISFTPFKGDFTDAEKAILEVADANHVYIDDVIITPLSATTFTGNDFDSILRPSRDYLTEAPPVQQWEQDYLEFFYDTEERYYTDMYDYLKGINVYADSDFRTNQPVTGTDARYGGLLGNKIMATMDYVDSHFYWDNHNESNTENVNIYNKAMVNNPAESLVGHIATSRVKDKPYTITEFGMPDPNEFRQEALPLMASYASLQDIDAVFMFTYNSLGGGYDSRDIVFEPEPIANRGRHNTIGEPLRESLIHLAANIFRRGDVNKAKNEIEVHVSFDNGLDQKALNSSFDAATWLELSGEIIDDSGPDSFDRRIALTNKVSLLFDELPQTVDFPSTIATVNLSDTDELKWTESAASHVVIDTQRSKVFVGYGNGLVSMNNMNVDVPASQFGSLSTTSMDGSPISTSSTMLITSIGKGGNRGVWLPPFGNDRVSICRKEEIGAVSYAPNLDIFCGYGIYADDTGPVDIELHEAIIELKGAAKTLTVQPLDSHGLPLGDALPATFIEGGYIFTVGNSSVGEETPWYEISAELPTPFIVAIDASLNAGDATVMLLPSSIPDGDYYIEISMRATEGAGIVEVASNISGNDSQTKTVRVSDVLQGQLSKHLLSDLPITILTSADETLQLIHSVTSGGSGVVYIDSIRLYRANMQPLADSDNDGMPNQWETDNGLNPMIDDAVLDLDSDGLLNIDEFTHGTNANNTDTDTDGMPDKWEIDNGLNPIVDDAVLDLDSDGLLNIDEFTHGTDANNTDTDTDGMPDKWEIDNDLNPLVDDGVLDLDGDGAVNRFEFTLGTKANNPDTDGDGMNDRWEYDHIFYSHSDYFGVNPTVADASDDKDADGLTNIQEYILNTDPRFSDTDADGVLDENEITIGTDPLNPDSDYDGVNDGLDNCPVDNNPNQTDSDNDTIGNVCDLEILPTLFSNAAEDGWVRESGENTNVGGKSAAGGQGNQAIRIGDHGNKRQYKAIISFDTVSIPVNAVIASAIIELTDGGNTKGDPTNLGTIYTDLSTNGFNSNAVLEKADFQAPATMTQVATLVDGAGGVRTADISVAGLQTIEGATLVQFRFAYNVDDNNNLVRDTLGHYASDHSDSNKHPRLIIEYTLPD